MGIYFYDNILRDLFIFIFRYLVGFFFIMQGIRGLKTGYDFVGEEMSPWIFKGGIVIGFLFGIGSSAFSSYGILVEILGDYTGATAAEYFAIIFSVLVIGATAFYSYRYWKKDTSEKK